MQLINGVASSMNRVASNMNHMANSFAHANVANKLNHIAIILMIYSNYIDDVTIMLMM
jgi:hypothetical protein